MSEIEPLEDGFGAPIDDGLAQSVPLVGFFDNHDGDGAIAPATIGFGDEPGHGDRGENLGVARPPLRDKFRGTAAGLGSAILAFWQSCADVVANLRRSPFAARRIRTAVFLVIAVAISGAAGVWIRNLVRLRPSEPRREATQPAVPLPPKSILIARAAMPPGHILRADDLLWQRWPDTAVGKSYILQGSRAPRDFAGYVVRAPIAAGEPISASNMIAPAGHGFLSAVLQPGMRAVSIDISPEIAAGGLIVPGDHVNVLSSISLPAEGSDGVHHQVVQTVAQDIRVLAIDQQLHAAAGNALGGRTATLEVTPKQAELITLAEYMSIGEGALTVTLDSLTSAASAETDDSNPAVVQSRDASALLPKKDEETAALKTVRRPAVVRGNAPEFSN